jgi:alpha-glucosidase
MKNILFSIFCFLIISTIYSQVTFILDELPDNTKKNDSIYISGDFEGWTGGQEKFKLDKKNNNYYIKIPSKSEIINFKFTRGSWNSVETDVDGKNIDNRNYIFNKETDTVRIVILNWTDDTSEKSTSSNSVSILSEEFFIPQLNRSRKIWIYLPPDYNTTTESYPVLYMHDGQNLFDDTTSFVGEWGVDETLNEMNNKLNFNLIVIGIENGGEDRVDEYSPWKNSKYGGGQGDAYIKFIIETLKPFVDNNYRTLYDKDNTGIMGSSLGALISHYGALKYPETFSKIGIFSPSFGFSNSCFDFAAGNSYIEDMRMYFMAGDKESSSMVSDMNKMIALMESKGFNKQNVMSKVVKNGEHNEKLWKDNFEEAILWLFSE